MLSQREQWRRQEAAMGRLKESGLFASACRWLKENPPPTNFQGTSLEYAELEMPVFSLRQFCKAISR
jgi:hypothetical protein